MIPSGAPVNFMNEQKKKIAYLLSTTIILMLFISILYPYGSKILEKARNRYKNPTYGKEIIYSGIENGDLIIADKILKNEYEISRFKPVVIDKITWKENSYDDIYWRFNFYNLEPVRNLLFAWEKTGKPEYKNKLIEITESFIDNGMTAQYSWDLHGVSFRTMTLVNVYKKLLDKNSLPEELNKKITEALKIHGDFLADPAHFENDYNHGLDQSAALYLLSINFPDMPNSDDWLKLSSARIAEMEVNIIDDNGILVENSPYYHFYVLEKFLEINRYLKQNDLTIEGFSEEKIDKMISYATYILQPDSSVPTIGASISRQINLFGQYREIVEDNPNLLYVLTQGDRGIKPKALNIYYPISGQTIMRSGWEKGEDFVNQTQLIFDVGDYRTNHSDFDALSFSLFGAGIPLMPDSGLYTYENGQYRSYFHGTRSHNTVVVDGKDQNMGKYKSVYAGQLVEGDGYVYQSAENNLNDGVYHKRAIMMIEKSTIIVLDSLESDTTHTYEQMFHLFPGAIITTDDLNLIAQGNKPDQKINIHQFITDGIELNKTINQITPPDGVCSEQYKVLIPCYSISYKKKGKKASYVTAISIGKNVADINFKDNIITVKTSKNSYSIKINETANIDKNIEVNKNFNPADIYTVLKKITDLNIYSNWYKVLNPSHSENAGTVSFNTNEKSVELVSPKDGSHIEASIDTALDLSKQNIYFKFKVDRSQNLRGFDLYLSNDNWEKYSKINVKSFIVTETVNQDGKWIQFGVAKGELRKDILGGWVMNDKTFDWSKIDKVKITVTSKNNNGVTVSLKDFSLAPDQENPRVIVIFDDGWDSVLGAAEIMKKYGLKGNVAIVTGSIGTKRYLTLDDLKKLQNDYGWDIANHSNLHKDAVKEYINTDNVKEFEDDLTDALYYLMRNNINSAPNWYIYPDGSRDNILDEIVEKYYKFARSTIDAPGSSPFANPFSVTTLPIYSNNTTPLDVHNAVSDAIKYNQTLLLMFHKISPGKPTVHTEYSRSDFESTIKDIKKQGIKVVTLSELDRENNVPATNFVFNDARPSQFTLEISTTPLPSRINNVMMNIWHFLIKI